MRLKAAIYLAQQDLGAGRARSIIAAVGIALGVGVLLVVASLGLGVRDVVLKEVVRELPVDMIEVLPRSMDLGLFQAESLFGGTRLNGETLGALRSLPQVEAAYPELKVRIPMGARGGERIFGRPLYTELFMSGVPESLVGLEGFAHPPDAGEGIPPVIPVVISNQLIEVFNSSVAPALGIPKLTDTTLNGFEFDIVLGRSMMLGTRGAAGQGVHRARIVGTSPHAMRLGVTVPLETARQILRRYGGEGDDNEVYGGVLVKARSPREIPAITAAVSSMGLSVDETAERTSNLLTAATALASLLGLLVLALAALNIAHAFFASLSERARELAILRAVGARRLDLVLIVEAQALMLGFVGGILGLVVAHLTTMAIDRAAAVWIPHFPFKPDTFFAHSMTLDALALGAAMLAAALGALWPALMAARRSVSTVLAEG